MTNRDFFVRCWEDEYPVFLKTFKAVPANRLDYRPHPNSRSAADLVWLQVVEKRCWVELPEWVCFCPREASQHAKVNSRRTAAVNAKAALHERRLGCADCGRSLRLAQLKIQQDEFQELVVGSQY